MPEQYNVVCLVCGKKNRVPPSRVENYKTCSRTCNSAYMKAQAAGEEVPPPAPAFVCPQGGACAYERSGRQAEVDAALPGLEPKIFHLFTENNIRHILNENPNETQCSGCRQLFVPKRRESHCPDCQPLTVEPPSPSQEKPQVVEIVHTRYRNASL